MTTFTPYVAPDLAKTRIVLETERLVLRRPEPRDFEVFRAFLHSDRAEHVRIPGPPDENTTWRAFCHVMSMWEMRGYGLCMVCLKGNDTALGGIGAWHPITWPEREIGWSIYDASIEGAGIAREAAEAVRNWAYNTLGWTTAVSYIDPTNAASIRLAERLGCTVDEAETKTIGDCIVYRHPAPEALK
ncbi:GNAT family N-acetyltransferase [Halocynthiibacter namhaensis]|uniref:GNAT family N-acetyltransferase n=1 Tax=Halocynthiibacter namhaensis TaxID=1290553 RepID=UPI000A7D5AA8|nr:GNAT family N-acetyltransferase [Halocynthiibacter namhaensis]